MTFSLKIKFEKLHKFYNNYSGLVTLWYFVKEVASYVLPKKRHWWVTRYQNKRCWISWLTWRTTEKSLQIQLNSCHFVSNFQIKHQFFHGIASWYSYLSMTSIVLTLWPPGRLLTALSIFPRSAFDGFYLQMSLSHGYLLQIRINQVREVSIVYCQWIVIAYGIPFHWKFFCKSGFKFSLWDFCHKF